MTYRWKITVRTLLDYNVDKLSGEIKENISRYLIVMRMSNNIFVSKQRKVEEQGASLYIGQMMEIIKYLLSHR